MTKKFTIYYCGNPLVEEDALPFQIIPELEKIFPEIEFVHHDPNENLPRRRGQKGTLIIIDTVINAEKVMTITDPDQLSTREIYSPHDWDLALNLKLLIKLGEVRSFMIIGVPAMGNLEKIIGEVTRIIEQI